MVECFMVISKCKRIMKKSDCGIILVRCWSLLKLFPLIEGINSYVLHIKWQAKVYIDIVHTLVTKSNRIVRLSLFRTNVLRRLMNLIFVSGGNGAFLMKIMPHSNARRSWEVEINRPVVTRTLIVAGSTCDPARPAAARLPYFQCYSVN